MRRQPCRVIRARSVHLPSYRKCRSRMTTGDLRAAGTLELGSSAAVEARSGCDLLQHV